MDMRTLLAFASTSAKVTGIINDIKAALGQVECNVGIQKGQDGIIEINIAIAANNDSGEIPDIIRQVAAIIDCAQQSKELATIFNKIRIVVKLASGDKLLLADSTGIQLLLE